MVELPPLEKECPKCEGEGWHSKCYSLHGRCDECRGCRVIPTEFGQAILDLIQHAGYVPLENVN